MPLTDAQVRRYSRQLVMKEITGAGQERLLAARVLAYGSGTSLELCVLYLAAAGVGAVHVSSQETVAPALFVRAAALNPDCAVSAGVHGVRPDAAVDFAQDASPAAVRQIAGALGAGIPYVKALHAGGAAVVMRWRHGATCPGCLLNALGYRQSDLIGAPDHGIAGPAAAAMILTGLLGIDGGAHQAVLLDAHAGDYREIGVSAFDGCVLCRELAGGKGGA